MSGGKLPEGWVDTQLGNIIELKYGKSLAAQTRDGFGFPVYGSNGVVGKHSIPLINKSGLIVGRKGSYGVVNKSIGPFFPIDTTYYIDDFYNQPLEFLFYYLSFLPLTKLNRSTAIPGLNRDDAYDLNIVLPPLAEQKIIAEKLDTLLAQVDSTKARLEQIPQILKRFRQAVLAAVVNGKSVNTDTDENTLTTLGNIAKNIKYGTSKKCSETQGSTAVLRIPNIGPGYIINSNLKYADFDQKELVTLTLKEGDLLLIRSNGSVDLVGKVAVISENDTEYLYAGYLIRVRLNKERAAPKYISYCLQSPQLRQVIENIARSTSGVNNINSKELASLEIPLPPLPEQHEIVRRVEQLFAYADTIEKQVNNALTRVNSLTQSILAKAFRGDLTAQWRAENPSLISGENSAAALLEKIKAERAASGGKKTRVKKPDTYFKRT